MRREREFLGKWKQIFDRNCSKKNGDATWEADLKTTTQNCLFRSGSTGAAVDLTVPPPTQPVTKKNPRQNDKV